MSNNKKRNHYVPRFLLNRFASRSKGHKHSIWQFRRGHVAREVSTKDSAVARYFYGTPDTGIEEKLSRIEGAQGTLIREIDAGRAPNECADEINRMVWLFTIRTKAIRDAFADAGNRVLNELINTSQSPAMNDLLRAGIDNRFDEEFEKLTAGLPESLREQAYARAKNELESTNIQGLYGQMLSMAQKQFNADEAAKEGQIQGLSQLLDVEQPPDWLGAASWRIKNVDAGAAILGAACVFAWDTTKRTPILLSNIEDGLPDIYFPISSSKVLFGQADQSRPVLSLEQINHASASFSSDAIFASRNTENEGRYAAMIGAQSELLDDAEVKETAKNSWTSLERD